MVATVGSISIDLSTNAAKFATGFKSSATTVEQQSTLMAKSVAAVEKSVNSVGATLKNFGAGIAAGAGLAAIASLGGAFDKLKETISEYDKIASDAKTTGLKTDTFQALAFAAKQANIEYDSFNSSLDIFAKNSGLAVRGQGALYSGLKNLNPQLLQAILNTKDQEERLKLVADAMAKTTDATKQAALATVVFGKGGIEMARILEQGRASIEKFKQTARDLGIIVPDDLLQRAGELDDKLDVLSKVIDVQLGESLIKLAPLLVGATTGFSEFSKELNAFSGLVANFQANPSLENFLTLLDQSRGTKDEGFLTKMVENYAKAFEEFGRIFTDATTNTSDESTAAIAANIRYLEDLLANLKQAAADGQDVQLETDQATAKLKALQAELVTTQASGISAANAISAGFAEAFRTAENASMDALAKMNAGLASAAASKPLPNVTRYGGDPNKITLPDQRNNYQPNANGSGVGVTSFKSSGPWENPNGATANEWAQLTAQNKQDIYDGKTTYDQILYGTDQTAGNTQKTSDNVSKLDSNTKSYLSSLSRDIGGYSQQQISQQSIVINSLSDAIRANVALPTSILAALVQKTDTADGSAAGNGFLTHDQVFIPGMTSYGGNVGHIEGWDSAAEKASSTSVNVARPGTTITLNYQAAAGESEQTAKQRARDMYNELLLQSARA